MRAEAGASLIVTSRNSHRYILRDGRETVQFGITNGAVDRAQEHLRDGKRFTTMTVVGPAVTRDTALDWERARIETYQRTHDCRRPRYNKM
jgi:predicted GIY-YIG superfamily endonuclease